MLILKWWDICCNFLCANCQVQTCQPHVVNLLICILCCMVIDAHICKVACGYSVMQVLEQVVGLIPHRMYRSQSCNSDNWHALSHGHHDYHMTMTITWLSHDHHMTMTITWLSHDHGHHMTTTWPWPSHDYHMTITDHHMTITWQESWIIN